MRTSRTVSALALVVSLAACSSSGGGKDGAPADSPSTSGGSALFSPEQRAVMDTAWRAFKKDAPDWPRLRDQWIALGPKATDTLVENMFRAMVIATVNNAPEWASKAEKELMLLGDRSVPVLSGVLERGEVETPSGPMQIPTELVSRSVNILVVVGAPAVPALATATDEGKPDVRRAAAVGLGRIGTPECVGPLADMVRSGKDWADRMAAAKGLGLIKGRESEAALIGALADPDSAVVQEAARSLARLKSTSAIPALEARRVRAEAESEHAVMSALSSAIRIIRGGR